MENISVGPDLTKMQRRAEEKLAREAENRNEQLTTEDREKNMKWMVVGRRGEKRLIKAVERDQQPYNRRGTQLGEYLPRNNMYGGGGGGGTGYNNIGGGNGGQGASSYGGANSNSYGGGGGANIGSADQRAATETGTRRKDSYMYNQPLLTPLQPAANFTPMNVRPVVPQPTATSNNSYYNSSNRVQQDRHAGGGGGGGGVGGWSYGSSQNYGTTHTRQNSGGPYNAHTRNNSGPRNNYGPVDSPRYRNEGGGNSYGGGGGGSNYNGGGGGSNYNGGYNSYSNGTANIMYGQSNNRNSINGNNINSYPSQGGPDGGGGGQNWQSGNGNGNNMGNTGTGMQDRPEIITMGEPGYETTTSMRPRASSKRQRPGSGPDTESSPPRTRSKQ
jgi:hypothetical protein